MNDNDVQAPSTVSISADTTSVFEGTAATFTLTANPMPTNPLTQSVVLRLSRAGFDVEVVTIDVQVDTNGIGMFTI